MKKIALLSFVFLLLSTAVAIEFTIPVISYPTEVDVLMEVDLPVHNIDSGKNFSTIQEAINDNETSNGHTIFVDAGVYVENIVVNKSVSLIGEERDKTIIESGIRESGTGTIVYVTANNVVISGFTIRNASETQNHDPLIYQNTGISVQGNFTNVMGNIITNTTYGIAIGGCSNVIYGNILTHNWRATAAGGYGSTIINNLVSNNIHGICPYICENNTITSNTIINNGIGIDILMSAINITITNNTIVNDGICFTFSGSSCAIYHNNFINSTAGVMDPPEVVTWDNGYPSGGNYWSDYTGVDEFSGPNQDQPGSDGIGDTPYFIGYPMWEYQDNYPLMYPWGAPPPSYNLTIHSSPTGVTFTVDGVPYATPWSGIYSEGASVSLVMPETHDECVWSHWLEDNDTNRTKTVTMDANITLTGVFFYWCDLNKDGKIDMRDISIAAKAFGSYPGHPRWNPIADINGDNKVDMRDIAPVARNFGAGC